MRKFLSEFTTDNKQLSLPYEIKEQNQEIKEQKLTADELQNQTPVICECSQEYPKSFLPIAENKSEIWIAKSV